MKVEVCIPQALTFDSAPPQIWKADSLGPSLHKLALGMATHCRLQQAHKVDTRISYFSVP